MMIERIVPDQIKVSMFSNKILFSTIAVELKTRQNTFNIPAIEFLC